MQKKAIYTIFLIVFIDLLGFSLILPLLPFIAEKYSANQFQIGLLTATYSFFQFIGAPILGRLSDKYGRKKLLVLSQIGTFFGFILLAFAHNLTLLFISRAIDGLTGGNISIAQAYIADVTNKKNRARGMGILGAAFGLGFIIGPVIGGLLSQISFAVPAIFAALISVVAILSTIFLLKETVDPKTNNLKIPLKQNSSKNVWQFVLNSRGTAIFPIIIVFFLLNTSSSSMQGNFALFTQAVLNFGPTQNGYLFTYIGILSVLTQMVILPFLLKKYSERSLFVNGVILLTIGFLLIPFSLHLVIVLIALFSIAVGNGIINPTIQSVASEEVDSKQYGQTLGYLQSAGSVGRILGPIVGGELFYKIDASAPFQFASLLSFIALVYGYKKIQSKNIWSRLWNKIKRQA